MCSSDLEIKQHIGLHWLVGIGNANELFLRYVIHIMTMVNQPKQRGKVTPRSLKYFILGHPLDPPRFITEEMDGSKELYDEMLIVVLLYPNVLIDPKLLANLNSLSKVVQVLFHIVSVDTKLPHNLGLELGKNLIEDLFLKQGVKAPSGIPMVLGGVIWILLPLTAKISVGHLQKGLVLGCLGLGSF